MKVMNRSTAGRIGPIADRSTNHGLASGPSASRISPSHPDASSASTAALDSSETPSPARAPRLIAPFDPSVSV